MEQGGIVGDVDVAQLMVILFVIFFVGLVLHLRQEDKREGYPMRDPAGGPDEEGFPPLPKANTFLLMDGGAVTAPHPEREPPLPPHLRPKVPGSPQTMSADPLGDAVGPAAYPMRRDEPLIYNYDKVQVLPLRSLPGWSLANARHDPRGMRVLAADGVEVGVVVDLWIDRSVKILRYLEVEATVAGEPRRVLLPIYYTDISGRKRLVKAPSIRGARFAEVPRTERPDTITAREEDRINAFYSGARFFNTLSPAIAS